MESLFGHSMMLQIRDISEERFNGDISAAAHDLMSCGIAMSMIPEDIRMEMKSGLVRMNGKGAELYLEDPSSIINALQI